MCVCVCLADCGSREVCLNSLTFDMAPFEKCCRCKWNLQEGYYNWIWGHKNCWVCVCSWCAYEDQRQKNQDLRCDNIEYRRHLKRIEVARDETIAELRQRMARLELLHREAKDELQQQVLDNGMLRQQVADLQRQMSEYSVPIPKTTKPPQVQTSKN